MAKLTMHDEIKALLVAESNERCPMTQPQITTRLRFDRELGSRALVLKELYERDPHIHQRAIQEEERLPEHGRARIFWWYDASKENNHFSLTEHTVGTSQLNHKMPIEELRNRLDYVLDSWEPSNESPVPTIVFPGGFWIYYASRETPVEF